MNRAKAKYTTLVVSALVILTSIIGYTYSYYNANVKEVNKTQTVIKSNTLGLTFTGTSEITAENMIPGDSFTKTFTVENTSNVAVTYNIYMQDITNEFNEDLVYTLTDEEGVVVSETVLPVTNEDKTYLKTGISIDAAETKTYTLKIEFKYSDENQDAYQGKTFSATVGIDTEQVSFYFDYTGSEQTFTVPVSGYYRLEVWGASGGSYNATSHGGYGGYSSGIISLEKGETLYINIGGQGTGGGTHAVRSGGYNGGGDAKSNRDGNTRQSSGGGATHIATTSGLLSTLENSQENLLIVAGGGGGGAGNAAVMSTTGGDGGGYTGNDGGAYKEGSWSSYGLGATQSSGGSYYIYNISATSDAVGEGTFGQGGSSYAAGGGGGYYGGGSVHYSGGGGSGYIGYSYLSNKAMYCYNCSESTEASTKTISTTNVSETATSQYAKIGDGYAKITFLG